MASPEQRRFWVFLKSVQSLFHISEWENVFDFVTYNNDARVRGNEVQEWELLIQYINYPIYGVCRALSVVRLTGDNANRTLFDMMQDNATMTAFVKLAAHFDAEVKIIKGRRVSTRAFLHERERSKSGLIHLLSNTNYHRNWARWEDETWETAQCEPGWYEYEQTELEFFEQKLLRRACGIDFFVDAALGVTEAVREVVARMPTQQQVQMTLLDYLGIRYQLVQLTYARNQAMFNFVYNSQRVQAYANQTYNELFHFLVSRASRP